MNKNTGSITDDHRTRTKVVIMPDNTTEYTLFLALLLLLATTLELGTIINSIYI